MLAKPVPVRTVGQLLSLGAEPYGAGETDVTERELLPSRACGRPVTVAALFVDPKGCYSGLPDVELWDEKRDARLYPGRHVVVAHPPCGRWCRVAHLNEQRWGCEVGSDGGCFASALDSVRRWGGVLEHPAWSMAWDAHDLHRPQARGWTRVIGDPGWCCEVSQRAYGHRAEKLTWLYYVGEAPPPSLDWSRPAPVATVSNLRNRSSINLPRLIRREASATPPAFRDLLLDMARSAR